jgi:hypothetical protein
MARQSLFYVWRHVMSVKKLWFVVLMAALVLMSVGPAAAASQAPLFASGAAREIAGRFIVVVKDCGGGRGVDHAPSRRGVV